MSFQLLFPCLLFLLFGAEKIIAANCPEDDLYVIRSTGANNLLVLDGGEPSQARIQYFTGYSSQLWQFKRGSKAGLYYIINNHTGNALDYVEDDLIRVVTTKHKNTLHQQWSLTLNGRIVNAANRRELDVHLANYNSGTRVALFEDNGTHAQWWDIQLVDPLQRCHPSLS